MHDEPKPKARGGLLSTDHSKRGRRFVTILDESSGQVTLLEPWEHAVLVLCDATRDAPEIAALLFDGVEGEPVTLDGVRRCLKFFERQALIDPLGLRRVDAERPTGPRTLANLQLAYREWHKDPVKTGQILAGDGSPFVRVHGVSPVGLSPTVALPDDDDKPAPVAIGTELVLSGQDGALADGQRPLRSVFETSQDARTEIGALDEPSNGLRAGGSAANESVDEEVDELELGDVADLLAAVDSDFDELEGAQPPSAPPAPEGPPPVRAIGGEARLPPSRDTEVATAELTVSETTLRFTPPEAALSPTLVGHAPEGDGDPVIISPTRGGVPRVGAVIGPTPSEARRNVSGLHPPPRGASDIGEGAVVEDTQRFDLPTDASFVPQHPGAVDSRPPPRHASVPPAREGTTNRSAAHLPARARAVFERLWSIGLEARAVSEETLDPKDRRRRSVEAQQFQAGLERLTEGELELALAHFDALLTRMPASGRVRAVSDAIRAALENGVAAGAERMLEDFTGAVEDAVAGGRCPRCLSRLAPGADACEGCGFSVGRADAAHSAG